MKKISKILKLLILLLILAIILVVIFLFINNHDIKNNFTNNIINFIEKPNLLVTNQTKTVETIKPVEITTTTPAEKTLPNKVDLKVPFTTQAPYSSWDDLHNDGCEEASIISVIYYLKNENLTQDVVENEIQGLVRWQSDNFGGHYDLPIAKTAELVEKYYQKQVNYSYDVTLKAIKTELANGNPVIVPLAGRVISNPYYRAPGPVYHMLIIRGYDDDKNQFVTNDVGTRHGEGYRYDYETLFNAIHDMPAWQQSKATLDADPGMISDGKKAMLIIK